MQATFEQINQFSSLSTEQEQQLATYVELLLERNKSINLIGRATEPDVWNRHILDAAQLVKYIPKGAKTITDFGSGAGLPAIILAIILGNDVEVHAVESTGKKARFMSESSRILNINLQVHNGRVEQITPWSSEIITARAFAPLDKLFEYILPFMSAKTLCILPKGRNIASEIESAQKNWRFNSTIEKSILADGNILIAKNLEKINDQK